MIKFLDKISFKLILVSIFLIPITLGDNRVLFNIGEFRNETYIYPLLLVVLIFLVSSLLKNKLIVPLNSPYFLLLIIFVLWSLLTFLFSFYDIYQSEAKGVNGVFRFVKQEFSLIFSVLLTPIILYNIFSQYPIKLIFQKIEKVIIWSLLLVFVLGILEVFSDFYDNASAHSFILWINENVPLIYIKEDLYLKRISSVSHEPPFLGMYLIFITPIILRGLVINNQKKKYTLLLLMIIILIFVSKSRAAQLFCLIEIFVFVAILALNKKTVLLKIIKGLILLFMLLPIVFLWKGDTIIDVVAQRVDSFKIVKNIKTNNSNKTRTGTIIAGLQTFSENPIVGVGYGQQGYYLTSRYPKWSVDGNWEIERYLKNEEKNFPPGFNLYVRYLAETGIIGFFIFILFISLTIFESLKKYLITKDLNYLFFFVSFMGFSLNWMQIDTPRIYGFWIVFVLFMIYERQQKYAKI